MLAAFLSWLRLSVYMAIVSVAIIMSFHLKQQASAVGVYSDSVLRSIIMAR